jgi:hypothetical protein
MAEAVVRNWRDVMAGAPDEVNSAIAFITAPPEEFVPEPARGQPVLGMVVSYNGPIEDAHAGLAPLREFGPPAADLVQPMPYVALQQLLDPANPKGRRNYWTADFLDALPDEAIAEFVALANQPVSPFSQLLLVPGGGAVARVDDDATAFGQRAAPFNVHLLSMWVDPADDAANIDYTRRLAATLKPWTTGRVYLNYIGEEGPGRVEAAFGPERYARLRELKATWDPDNLFRHNQNIPPAA